MKAKSELKIAAIVGAIMIIICLIVVIINSPSQEDINIQVFKNTEIDGKRGYVECQVPDSILGEINTEFKKAQKLNATDQAERHQIEGTYKIVSGKNSIAFDNSEKNEIYNINDKNLYNFKSTIYSLVESVCE